MGKISALILVLGLAACGSTEITPNPLYPRGGEVVTRQQACGNLAAAEAFHRSVRTSSLAGHYGVSRIEAEQLVSYWTQYCPEGAQ